MITDHVDASGPIATVSWFARVQELVLVTGVTTQLVQGVRHVLSMNKQTKACLGETWMTHVFYASRELLLIYAHESTANRCSATFFICHAVSTLCL